MEYLPLLQWSAQRKDKKWISSSPDVPEIIQPFFDIIYTHLLHHQERVKMDEELSGLSLSISDTEDNTSLKRTIEQSTMNFDWVALKQKLSDLNGIF